MKNSLARSHLDGSPWRRGPWVRDLALIGAATCLIIPMMTLPSWLRLDFAIVAAAAGAVSGAMIGWLAPNLLHPYVRRLPVVLLLGAGFGLGSVWGAVAGSAAALSTGTNLTLSASTAAICGGLQLGWIWLPYTVFQARGERLWILVFLALLFAVVLGTVMVAAWELGL